MANRIQIQNALQKPYDRILFGKEVLSPVFGSCFTMLDRPVPSAGEMQPNKSEQAVIQSVSIYGTINLEDGTEITCYEINLQPSVRIEHSKVAIQRYVRKLLTAGQIALVNFIAPQNKKVWRLTLVAKDSELTEQGIKEKTTQAKRYTYLLGPSETCKTAAERFESLSTEKQITFQALVNAFSVEKLSKAFFDEYTQHYKKFCEYLQESNFRKSVFKISIPSNATKEEKDKACKPIRDFVKKLLGRIVFLYFVQKKGWLGASDTNYKDGLTDFIKQLFKQSGGNDVFYSTWLTVLFFETLNKERSNDDFKMPDGKKVKVPFLNGGLFDKEEHDEHILTFKSKLFHHPDFEDTLLTAKNKDNARGFLDFLDAFNFTVHEDSPDDHTVAVDPEMLGHIFENLLEDNKDKGAFYTPKEIVHYMCQESLTEYLTTHLSKVYTVYKEIGNAQIELFGNETKTGQLKLVEELGDKALNRNDVAYIVKHKDISHLTKAQLKKIDALLDTVKICDPAIGSGAFPMGLLQEIHAIKEVIAYELQQPWKPADVKENIIQNSVYGVDIEKGAVDIARLRFWLSLVVDEEKPRALPNLDYKIVVGDSLVSKFEGEIIEIDWERKSSVGKADTFVQNIQRLLIEIAEKQKNFFKPDNKDKKKLQTEIRNLKLELLTNQLSFNKESYELKNKKVFDSGFGLTSKERAKNKEIELKITELKRIIAKLQNLKQNKEEPFEHFDWKLDFPEVLNPYLVNGNTGFDIVIGNPPYIQLQKMGKETDILQDAGFETFARTGDIYCLFYEKGFDLLKKGGTLTYITSNKWMRGGYGKSLRNYFTKVNTQKIMNLGPGIFHSATVDTNIYVGKREPFDNQVKGISIENRFDISFLKEDELIPMRDVNEDAWVVLDEADLKISRAFEKYGKPLRDWNLEIYRGVLTGFNEAFIIDQAKRDELVAEDPKADEIIRPILKGREIERYYAEWSNDFIISTFPAKNLDINEYPRVKSYLEGFQPKLNQSGEEFINQNGEVEKTRKKTLNKWFETQDPIAFQEEFKKEKVIWKRIGSIMRFAYSDEEIYCLDSTCIATGEKIKYLTAVLNSKAGLYQLFKTSPQTGTGDQIISVQALEPLLVHYPSDEVETKFNLMVDYILFIKKSKDVLFQSVTNEHVSGIFENLVDMMVYELYFEEEMKAKEIDVLKFVTEKAFPDITQAEDPKAIIQKVYYELQQKDNPIRNRILVASSRSETIARINAATNQKKELLKH